MITIIVLFGSFAVLLLLSRYGILFRHRSKRELASKQIQGEFIQLNHREKATFIVNHKNKQLSPTIKMMTSLIKEQGLHWN